MGLRPSFCLPDQRIYVRLPGSQSRRVCPTVRRCCKMMIANMLDAGVGRIDAAHFVLRFLCQDSISHFPASVVSPEIRSTEVERTAADPATRPDPEGTPPGLAQDERPLMLRISETGYEDR